MAAVVEPIESVQQPMSDDQELAKVLAGINQQTDDVSDATTAAFTVPPVADDISTAPVEAPALEVSIPPMVESPMPDPIAEPAPAIAPLGSDNLTSVKSEAINELRPLVDKLNVPAEEKFDTYLLLLRSTDDRTLIAPAHEIAKLITDEARRAQALLDIIKEIDFLNQSQA